MTAGRGKWLLEEEGCKSAPETLKMSALKQRQSAQNWVNVSGGSLTVSGCEFHRVVAEQRNLFVYVLGNTRQSKNYLTVRADKLSVTNLWRVHSVVQLFQRHQHQVQLESCLNPRQQQHQRNGQCQRTPHQSAAETDCPVTTVTSASSCDPRHISFLHSLHQSVTELNDM